MKIGLMGLGDKRHIVYTLIRVLSNLGRTVIFTPNSQYLMLSEEYLPEFEICDAQMAIYNCDIDDLCKEYDLDAYSYVVYDIQREIPFDLDIGMILDSRDYYVAELKDRELDDVQLFSVQNCVKSELLTQEVTIKLPTASKIEKVLYKMFDERRLLPVTNSDFIRGMTPFMTQITELSAGQISASLKKGVMEV